MRGLFGRNLRRPCMTISRLLPAGGRVRDSTRLIVGRGPSAMLKHEVVWYLLSVVVSGTSVTRQVVLWRRECGGTGRGASRAAPPHRARAGDRSPEREEPSEQPLRLCG